MGKPSQRYLTYLPRYYFEKSEKSSGGSSLFSPRSHKWSAPRPRRISWLYYAKVLKRVLCNQCESIMGLSCFAIKVPKTNNIFKKPSVFLTLLLYIVYYSYIRLDILLSIYFFKLEFLHLLIILDKIISEMNGKWWLAKKTMLTLVWNSSLWTIFARLTQKVGTKIKYSVFQDMFLKHSYEN